MPDLTMTVPLTALVGCAALIGLLTGALTPAILRRLPEPVEQTGDEATDGDRTPGSDSPDSRDVKVPYVDLANPRFAVSVGAVVAGAVAVAGWSVPASTWPCWLVLATVGVLLAGIDARTTWLPLPLTRVGWAAMALALMVGAGLGGGSQLARGLGGFVLAGAVFGAAWWVTRGGFGFGDVRYAPLVGAATASVSWTLLAWALVLGSLAGAAVGLLRLAAGRRGAFAYAPSILAGAYLAAGATWLTT